MFCRFALQLLVFLVLVVLAGPEAYAATPTPRFNNDYLDSDAHVFLDEEVTAITVTMEPADLESFIADPWQDEYRMCSVHFNNSMLEVTVDSVGIRVRGNTSRQALKKSWKLSFNTFVPGRQFHGLEKMNLNGEHNDPSITRSKLSWDVMNRMSVPGSRAAPVRLIINDGTLVDGIFINIEQIDEEFVEAWFGNKNGNLYKCLYKGERADLKYVAPGDADTYRWLGGGETYAEKNNDLPDYTDLAGFIQFINHSSDTEFAAGIVSRLNVDNFLRAMAVDVVIGNWDNYWYGSNNYYLYHNEDTNRFEYIPYDLDNTVGVDFFGINWSERPYDGWGDWGYGSSGEGLPPLIRRLLAVPAFEVQLRRYVLEVATQHFTPELWNSPLDATRVRLEPLAFLGSYAEGNMDWDYNGEIFSMAFDYPEYYSDNYGGWDHGLKPFIAERTAWLPAHVTLPPALPELFINEFLADNFSGLQDETGAREDWVEIHNGSSRALDLEGYHLSDDLNDPLKWAFPDTTIAPGGFLIVWCDNDLPDGPLHASFKLGKSGEMIGLTGPIQEGAPLVDHHVFGTQTTDVSRGRKPDGSANWMDFPSPTPGQSNLSSSPVNLDEHGALKLSPAFPNPFNPRTLFRFSLERGGPINFSVYDLAGRRVRILRDNNLVAGDHQIVWDGCDQRGQVLPSGVYFGRLSDGQQALSQAVVLVR
jgi:CotH kinase protein/Lamin Tail Domain